MIVQNLVWKLVMPKIILFWNVLIRSPVILTVLKYLSEY